MLNIFSDFIFFSMIGYIGEVIHCALRKRKSGKALRGPWCPLYGVGGLFIFYFLDNFNGYPIVIYFFGVLIASFIEYFASLILELIFKTRWWDYTGRFLNINGRICFQNSILFGLLALTLFYIYIPCKSKFVSLINENTYIIIVVVLGIIMIIDALVTVLEAVELKRRLNIIEHYKKIDKETLKLKLVKLKTTFNPNRLLRKFNPLQNEKNKLLQIYYKKKSNFKLKK